MAYARKGSDESDVYVVGGYEAAYVCIGCELAAPHVASTWELPDVRADTPRDMMEHLRQHQRSGHVVPEAALSRLREDSSK